MAGEDPFSSFPPPSPPPPPPIQKKRGSLIVLGGVIFAFLPILINLIASIFIDDALNEGTNTLGTLPWLTIFTLPIGGVIVLVGLTTGSRNVGKRRP